MTSSRATRVAAVGGIVLLCVIVAVRFSVVPRAIGVTPEALLPLLIAGALLCVVGLSLDRAPGIAWLATVLALATLTIDLLAGLRVAWPALDDAARRAWSIVAGLAATWTAASAVASASDRQRCLGSWVRPAGIVATSIVGLLAVWTVAMPIAPGAPIGPLGLVSRSFLVVTVVFVALGLLGDAQPAWLRARRRIAVTHPTPVGWREQLRSAQPLLRAFVDELAPGRSRERHAVVAERSRIARDLHADVVPGLRRAIRLADGGGSIDELAAGLREILDEVEALSAAQHAIQLEVGGFVPAVEWIAERAESRSGLEVTLDVEDGDGRRAADAGEPPAEVAAGAFRVVGLALDNAARHAPGCTVAIRVRADRRALDLSIADDGPGISREDRAAATAAGRRGLADMVAEGVACGATVEVDARPDGRGTVVRFAWSAG